MVDPSRNALPNSGLQQVMSPYTEETSGVSIHTATLSGFFIAYSVKAFTMEAFLGSNARGLYSMGCFLILLTLERGKWIQKNMKVKDHE